MLPVFRFQHTSSLSLLLCLLTCVIGAPLTPGFASSGNVLNILGMAAPLLILALGQMLVMISAGIDLSGTAIMAVASIWGAQLMQPGLTPLPAGPWLVPLVVVAMPCIGGAFGAANGALISWGRIPPFLATLISMVFLYGLAAWWTRSASIGNLPTEFIALGSQPWIVFPVAATIAILVDRILRRTLYGRWLYALGSNPETAWVSGVAVQQTVFVTYAGAGFLAGTAAILFTAQLETGSPVLGKNLMLDVIGAVVIGGTSLFGGVGRVSWTVGGVLFLVLLENILSLHNLSHFVVMMAKGALILAACLLDSLRRQRKSQ